MKHQNISLREANHNFSRLIAAVERGEAFCITRRGQEVARLIPSPLPALPVKKNLGVHDKTAGVSQGQEVPAAITALGATLGDRVLQLEVRLDKISSALPPIDKQ